MKSNTSGGYWCRLSFEVAAFFLILVNICTGVEVQLIPSTEESTCDVQYATLGTTQCQYAHIRVAYLDLLANLTNVMVDIDKTNQLVRRMYIDVHVHTHLDENTEVHTDPLTNSTEITIDTQKIDEYIDSFLTPRPWWIVGHEGVTQTHTSPTQSHTTQKFSYHIYLLRYSQTLERGLKLLSDIQFPDRPDACENTPMHVHKLLGKGWGSQMMIMEGAWSNYLEYIHIVWDSPTNTAATDITPYTSKDLCPTVQNKHDCAYLSMTSCPMPRALINTHGLENMSHIFRSDTAVFNCACEKGIQTNWDLTQAIDPPRPVSAADLKSSNTFVRTKGLLEEFRGKIDSTFQYRRSVTFYDARGHLIKRSNGVNHPQAMYLLTTQGFMFRMRAHYRRMVYDKVAAFRTANNFPLSEHTSDACVSIHIRRGDRAAHTTDIKEYCSSYRRFNNGTCVNIKNRNEGCGVGQFDQGCFSEHPYATLLLTDYLDRAEKLMSREALAYAQSAADNNTPSEKINPQLLPTVFIMTDDAAWLTQQIGNLSYTHPHTNTQTSPSSSSTNRFKFWRVLAMPARFDGHSGHERQHANHETDSGVEFLASIALARTCQGFVGHFGSGLTVGIAHTLCYQHGVAGTGHCPNIYDIGYAYHEDGHQLWLPPMTIEG